MSIFTVENIFGSDISSVVFSYLKFKDASSICQISSRTHLPINKEYQFSFVSLNYSHPQYVNYL